MKIETIFIINSAGKKVPIGTMRIREKDIGLDATHAKIIYNYYVDEINLSIKKGDKLSS